MYPTRSSACSIVIGIVIGLITQVCGINVGVGLSPVNVAHGQNAVLECSYSLANPEERVQYILWYMEPDNQPQRLVVMHQLVTADIITRQYYLRDRKVTHDLTSDRMILTIQQTIATDNAKVWCGVQDLFSGQVTRAGPIELNIRINPSRPYMYIRGEPWRGTPFTAVCRSDGGKPASTLRWFIDNRQTTDGVTERTVERTGGVFDSVSEMIRTGIENSTGITVRCQAEHPSSGTQNTEVVIRNVGPPGGVVTSLPWGPGGPTPLPRTGSNGPRNVGWLIAGGIIGFILLIALAAEFFVISRKRRDDQRGLIQNQA